MRIIKRLQEWLEYRRDVKRTRREYRNVRRDQIDHAESERFRGSGAPMGHDGGGGGLGGGGG
jgi:hypothetical protein